MSIERLIPLATMFSMDQNNRIGKPSLPLDDNVFDGS